MSANGRFLSWKDMGGEQAAADCKGTCTYSLLKVQPMVISRIIIILCEIVLLGFSSYSSMCVWTRQSWKFVEMDLPVLVCLVCFDVQRKYWTVLDC